MRIGIYSGTFDPVHEGHILFAEIVCEQFTLDKVLIIPEQSPRYKSDVTSIKHRLNMLQLATSSTENDIEPISFKNLENHTVNGLLSEIYTQFPDDEYFIVMGSDVFKGIESWGSRQDEDGAISDIAESIGFIVGINSLSDHKSLKEIADSNNLNTRFIEVPAANISSSNIRQAISRQERPRGVNDLVLRYIDENQLYN